MAGRWDAAFLWLVFIRLEIEIFGRAFVDGYLFQGENAFIGAKKKIFAERLYDQPLGSLEKINRRTVLVQCAEIGLAKTDGVAAVHCAFSDDGQGQVYFFLRWLRFKDG